jgi:hypothetical protein
MILGQFFSSASTSPCPCHSSPTALSFGWAKGSQQTAVQRTYGLSRPQNEKFFVLRFPLWPDNTPRSPVSLLTNHFYSLHLLQNNTDTACTRMKLVTVWLTQFLGCARHHDVGVYRML